MDSRLSKLYDAIETGKFEGASPSQQPLLPLSFEGEGD